MKMTFNKMEVEIIFLKAIKELIDSMVNYEMLDLCGHNPDMSIRFKSMTHQKYFNIILLDFLSCSDRHILGEQLSYLGALKSICQSPKFNKNGSITNLAISTKEFIKWLETIVVVENVWLPSIQLKTNLSIRRIEFIKICGNISKHNFSRLSGVACELIDIFGRNNILLNIEKALLILGEFYDWFHTDIFNYHSSAIAEFLNNIRWDIYKYLQPEFKESIIYTSEEHPRLYQYTYPKEIVNGFARSCYWDLMNEVRSKPYISKFQVTKYLKMRY